MYSEGFHIALPAAWPASYLNDGMTAAEALQALRELKPGVVHSRTRSKVDKGSRACFTLRALQGHGGAGSRERLHAHIHVVAVDGGGPRGIRGAWFRHSHRVQARSRCRTKL